jgi:prolipoprotein diacylglyceryltransferase
VTNGLYHPTFLYECLWNIGVALLLLWVDRPFTLRRGKLFALYVVAVYTVGRFWIEALRVDHANHLGLRLNDWTSLLVFVGALAALLWRRRPDARPDARGEDPELVAEDAEHEVALGADVRRDAPQSHPSPSVRVGASMDVRCRC